MRRPNNLEQENENKGIDHLNLAGYKSEQYWWALIPNNHYDYFITKINEFLMFNSI